MAKSALSSTASFSKKLPVDNRFFNLPRKFFGFFKLKEKNGWSGRLQRHEIVFRSLFMTIYVSAPTAKTVEVDDDLGANRSALFVCRYWHNEENSLIQRNRWCQHCGGQQNGICSIGEEDV